MIYKKKFKDIHSVSKSKKNVLHLKGLDHCHGRFFRVIFKN